MEKTKKHEKKVPTQTETVTAVGVLSATAAGAARGFITGGPVGAAVWATVSLVGCAATSVVIDEINDKG